MEEIKATLRRLLENIPIESIMTRPTPTVNENEDLSEVERIFIEQGVSHVCVVNAQNQLTGLISQKYLYKIRSPQKILPGRVLDDSDNIIIDGDSFYDVQTLDGYILRDLMDKNVTTLAPQDSLLKAVQYMTRLKVGCIPIVNEHHKVQGVLKESNIVKMLAELSS